MRRRTAATVVLVCAAALVACSPSPGPRSGCDDDVRTAGSPGDAAPLLVLGDIGFSPTIVYDDGAVVVPLGAATASTPGTTATAPAAATTPATATAPTAATPPAAATAPTPSIAPVSVKTSSSARPQSAQAAAIRPLMAPGYGGPQPGGFVGGSLTACQLAAVASRADALFSPSVDFGEPMVTDSGSTDVSYRDGEVSVYAFTRSDPTQWSDLGPGAQQARQELADLWDLVEREAVLGDVLPISRLHVHVFGDVDDDELVDWPLSTPLSALAPGGCGTLDDPEQVAALVDRLGDDHPMLETGTYRLAILAAAPGAPPCDP